jgi:hypothetical protein
VRIHGYFSKLKGVRERKSLGNAAVSDYECTNLQRDIVSVLGQTNSAQDKRQVGARCKCDGEPLHYPNKFYFLKKECGVNWLHSSKEAEVLENQGLVRSVVAVVMKCPTQL